jgi:hypothetical protein
MNEHLVAYEYGAGRVWGLVEAPSMGAVRDALPELEIYAAVPEWMLPSDLDEIRSRALVSISDENPVDSIFEAARLRRKG